MPTQSDGIAADIFRFFLAFLNHGTGVNEHYVTTGDNVPHKILPNSDRLFYAFTVANNGTSNITVGWNGSPTFPIPPGGSYTFRGKNPRIANLVFSDLGSPAVVDVIS